MKKLFIPFCVALTSLPVLANPGFYVGADYTFDNETEFKLNGAKASLDNDSSFNLVAGYETMPKQDVGIIAELEYSYYGDASYGTGKVDGRGLFLNIKPIFYDGSWYLTGIAGIGDIKINVKNDTYSISDSEIGYQLGAELGYQLNPNISLGAGYKIATAEFDDLKVQVGGFYISSRFHF